MLHPFRRYSNSFRRWSRSKSVFCNGGLPATNDGADSSSPPPCNGTIGHSTGLVKGLSPFLACTEAQANTQPRRSSVFFSSLVAIPLGSGRLKGGFRESVYAISSGLEPLLIFMRILGLFPCQLRTSRQNRRFLRFSKRVAFLLLTLAALMLNVYVFRLNIVLLLRFRDLFGIMNASSVSTMVSGIKPLINAVILILFSMRVQAHLRMLRLMDGLDRSYWSAFHASPNVRGRMLPVFFGFLFFSLIIPLAYRLFDILKLEKTRSFLDWLQDYTVLLVPLLTVWNVLPLYYYVLCNRLACFWCRSLVHALQKEHHKRRYSLKFYYQQFLRLADLQQSIGDVFNPFVFFSLAWALLILSMTIYFLTQPTSRLYDPITIEQMTSEHHRRLLNERILVNLGWSLLQIVVAIGHIAIICAVGTITNEESRNILTAVLAVIPDTNAELDRFQISCFVHKISTQYLWGMSVWKAFPLERSTFFTLVSVIFTYSFLLLKLKDNTASPTPRPFLSTIPIGTGINESAKIA